ncbi:unnamed protein product [Cylindrotheca closterium]|uniref:Uncharacterized protein n=1 Tax=Cylindrotheca closterium TaxID=2856 RepID=A0AAD2PUS0_9STRA|nr:unnamed protein product [Cylindrotheca closterium]
MNLALAKTSKFTVQIGVIVAPRTRCLSSLTPVVKDTYYVPRADRGGPNDSFVFNKLGDGRLARQSRHSPTRELNFTPTHWERQKSVWLRFRAVRTIFHSSPFQRLMFPDLFTVGATASAVAVYNTQVAENYMEQLTLHGSALSGATTALGMLVAFRLNASYGRYDEGRKFWGEINNAARDLAGNACMWIDDPYQKDRMLKLIKAFPVITHFHLNAKGGHFMYADDDPDLGNKLYAELHAELLDIYKDEEHEDFKYICSGYLDKIHLPLHVSAGMRRIIADNGAYVNAFYNKTMDEQVRRIVMCLGQAERVLRTPLPTDFTRHTSRLLALWCFLLPFAIYDGCGPLGVVPASMMISYAILGIEDVGLQIEEPFNILPIRQYSDGINAGVDAIANGYDLLDNNPLKRIAAAEETTTPEEPVMEDSTKFGSDEATEFEEDSEPRAATN